MKKTVVFVVCCFVMYQFAIAGIYRDDRTEAQHADLAAEPQFDCVGTVWKGKERQGSCVLIGTRYVLTAAHVVTETFYRKEKITTGGQTIIVNQPYAEHETDTEEMYCNFADKKYRCKTIHTYPTYLAAGTKHKCDIALIELEEPVAGVKPSTFCRSFDELNAEIVGVGYGANGFADQPENVKATRKKLAGQNTIDSLCGYKVNGQFVSMLCDFDHPSQPARNRMGSCTALPQEYVTSGGDSGGGAFRKTAKGWELIGICGGSEHGGVDIELLTTKGVGYYDQVMEWQRVSVFAGWVDGLVK